MKKINWILLAGIIFGCCQNDKSTKTTQKIKEIILVNTRSMNRCEIGGLIRSISKCNPKAIGINLLFDSFGKNPCDTTLQNSIKDSGKVILVEGYENGKLVESDERFSDFAMLTGPTGLSEDENGNFDYYYRITTEHARYSFPFQIALQYDISKASNLAAISSPKDYSLLINNVLRDFKVINPQRGFQYECDSLEGKIVVVGYLEPGTDDRVKTTIYKNSPDSAYRTVMIANVVLDILRDLE